MHDYFLWYVHYIQIFFFISFFYLCALNSVLWKFLRSFLDLKFEMFSPWNMKTTRSWFCMYSRGKMSIFKSRKNGGNLLLVLFLFTRPIILAKGIIWYNAISNFKKYFWKMPAIWDTLMDVWSLSKNYPGFN